MHEHMKWCQISICLDLAWNWGLDASAIANWLSSNNSAGDGWMKFNLVSKVLSHITWVVAFELAMYHWLLLWRPHYCPSTNEEHVSRYRSPIYDQWSPICVQVAGNMDVSKVTAVIVSDPQIFGALQVSEYSFYGLPMIFRWLRCELTQGLNCKGDVGSCAHGSI